MAGGLPRRRTNRPVVFPMLWDSPNSGCRTVESCIPLCPSPQSLSNDLFIASISSRERPRRLAGTAGIVGPVSVAADGTAALFASGTVMANL